jgi:hypothetical protein
VPRRKRANQFIRVWLESETASAAARALGRNLDFVLQVAARFRALGVALPRRPEWSPAIVPSAN